VVPSVNVHAEGKAAGALVEVASGRIVFLTSVEARQSGLCRSYYTDDKTDEMNVTLRDTLHKKLAGVILQKLHEQQTLTTASR